MMMGFEPVLEVFQQATSSPGGSVSLPWVVVLGVPSALVSAIVYQTKRITNETKATSEERRRAEERYDRLVDLLLAAGRKDADAAKSK